MLMLYVRTIVFTLLLPRVEFYKKKKLSHCVATESSSTPRITHFLPVRQYLVLRLLFSFEIKGNIVSCGFFPSLGISGIEMNILRSGSGAE